MIRLQSRVCRYVFVGILLLPLTVNAEVYKWVDEQGKVQFSDKAVQGKKNKVVHIRNTHNRINQSQNKKSKPLAADPQDYLQQFEFKGDINSAKDVEQYRQEIMRRHMQAQQAVKENIMRQQGQYTEEPQKQKQKSRNITVFSGRQAKKRQKSNIKKYGIGVQANERIQNTLTQCQRYPMSPRCQQQQMSTGSDLLDSKQKHEQGKIRKWQNEKNRKIDEKYRKQLINDYRKSYQ